MITATRYPAFSRNFEDEQDYTDAAVCAARKTNPLLPEGLSLAPVLRWNRQRRQQQQQQQQDTSSSLNKLKCKTLVVGFEGGGASFAQKCFGLASDDGGGGGCSTDWIGTVVLPLAPSGTASTSGVGLGDSFDPADPLNSACNIFLKRAKGSGKASTHGGSGHDRSCNGDSLSNGNGDGDGAAAAGGSEEPESSTPTDGGAGGGNANNSDEERDGGDGVAVVLCGCRVPPSQADAWAKALLSGIDAEVVVALTAVAVEPGRSEAWQGARLIATAEAEEREDCLKMSVGFQPLRTPTMLTGVSAALVSFCQRHGRAAMCFVTAELPGRRVTPTLTPTQQFGVGDGGGGDGGSSLLLAERSLACTRKPLGVIAAEAMVAGGGGGVEGAEEGEIAALNSATSGLYI